MSVLSLLSLLLILSLSFFCSEPKSKETVPEKPIEGWAGPPNDLTQKPFDYFYMRKVARASEKAVNKRDGKMIQATCVDAATTQAKGDLINILVGESLTNSCHDGESTGPVIVREYNGKLKGVNIKECKPKAVAVPGILGSEYAECECVIFVKIPGGKDAIIAQLQEIEKAN
ncbi:MAG: lipoprotein LipL21 [Leptospiraceae bacterium]|nr:lipoprotein LipL21 [Leptospiraceae bacterium]